MRSSHREVRRRWSYVELGVKTIDQQSRGYVMSVTERENGARCTSNARESGDKEAHADVVGDFGV